MCGGWHQPLRPGASVRGGGLALMADRPLARLFWRVLDALDYWATQARLWALDLICSPER